jgi:hypothetical protein
MGPPLEPPYDMNLKCTGKPGLKSPQPYGLVILRYFHGKAELENLTGHMKRQGQENFAW